MREKLKKIPVSEFTSRCPVTVTPETHYNEVAGLMVTHDIRHLPVTDDSGIVGMISERQLKLPAQLGEDIHLKAGDIMVPDPYCVEADATLEEVAFEMSKRKIGSAIVTTSSGKLTGIFTTTDALNALIEVIRGEWDS